MLTISAATTHFSAPHRVYGVGSKAAWCTQSSGNEVFLRNPYNVNENLYVTISSPSSSKYKESDLQSPDATAQVILKQFLTEYMSTRLGVRREADVVDAALLNGEDQKQYSQIQVQAGPLR